MDARFRSIDTSGSVGKAGHDPQSVHTCARSGSLNFDSAVRMTPPSSTPDAAELDGASAVP
jgi:hypothetical protein